jgi:signal transduction histidine kinase
MDPEKFRQVLMNLMQNAIQAMDGQGKITVTTSVRRAARGRIAGAEGASISRRSLVEDLELVEVSVRDTGPGISPKVLRNLFIPFFTTKAQGTGLGLAISQSIVQNAGGAIEVHSQPGDGTTFTIVLPAAGDALASPLPEPPLFPAPSM